MKRLTNACSTSSRTQVNQPCWESQQDGIQRDDQPFGPSGEPWLGWGETRRNNFTVIVWAILDIMASSLGPSSLLFEPCLIDLNVERSER